MRDEAMPNDGLESLGVRRHARIFDRRDHDNNVAGLLGIAAVTAHNAEYFEAPRLALLDRADDVGADVLFQIAAANRKNEDSILGIGAADLEPFGKYRRPAFVVGPRRELRDIVGRRIGFDPAEL